MKFLKRYSSFSKKNRDYKFISIHNKVLKKLNLESTILNSKTVPIIGIYKLFKNLLIRDNIQLSDEQLVSIIIYSLSIRLKLNLESSEKLKSELESEIPDFKQLNEKIKVGLNTILIITNIVFKKDGIVISGFKKFLSVKIILKILNLMITFTKEHNISLYNFSNIIHQKDQKVFKNIVDFINNQIKKDRYYIEDTFKESIQYNFKNEYVEQKYKPILDKIHNSKIGDILDNEFVYLFVEYLTDLSGRYEESFIDGDLGDRLDKYEKYILKELYIEELDINEWEWNDSKVDKYVKQTIKNKDYPPIVVDNQYSIIDGIHRANALKRLGFKKILALVGIF